MTSTDGVKHSRFFFLLLSLLLSLVFTPPGVSLLDEDADEVSKSAEKRLHLGRVSDHRFPDEVSLERFLQHVTGDRDETWSSAYPACQWRGVTCNREGKVTGINWNTEKLQGTLHWENLPSTVEYLYLQSSSDKQSLLGGTLDLSVLPRGLKTIDLTENNFYGPLDLTALPSHLEQADFSLNNFSGSLDLTRLPSTLKWIELSFNSFSGPVDLTKLPEEMFNLNLSHNQLSGAISLTKLPNKLYQLSLNNNQLTGVVDLLPLIDWSRYHSRVLLRLENNFFRGYYPKGSVLTRVSYKPQNTRPSHVRTGTNPIVQGPGPTSITHGRKPTSVGGKTSRPSDEVWLERFLQNVTGERDKTWSSAYPACQWRNVTCNMEGKVTGINWNTEKLQGTLHWENLPSTVEHLLLRGRSDKQTRLGGTLDLSVLPRGLKTLYLAGHSFYGPLELTALPPHLEEANFSLNYFSGSLDLTRLPSTLKWISLSWNQFKSSVDLTKLPGGMTNLELDHNQLSGEISLNQLPRSLQHLYLNQNHLCGPVDLTKLPGGMTNLELDHNQLSGEISLNQLPRSLQHLYLNQNNFSGPVDFSLQQLPSKLSQLFLQNNRLTGVVDLHPLLDWSRKNSRVSLRLDNNFFRGYYPKGSVPAGVSYEPQGTLPSQVRMDSNPIAQDPGPTSITQGSKSASVGVETPPPWMRFSSEDFFNM